MTRDTREQKRAAHQASLAALSARLRHERLVFITETLVTHGHVDPVSVTVSYTLSEQSDPVVDHVTVDGDTCHSVSGLLGEELWSDVGDALNRVLQALVREDHDDTPEKDDGQLTYLLPRPSTSEIA